MGGSMEDALVFYRQYHKNKWNQLIHIVFVPVIMWTVLVWLAYAPPLANMPDVFASEPWLDAAHKVVALNAGLIVVAVYSAAYLLWEPVSGASWSLCVGLPLWMAANYARYEVPDVWKWALGLHVLAWYMQIHPGHALLERRKPALLDGFVQAFAAAPLFVWLEVLFCFGYRKDLQEVVHQRAAAKSA